MEAASLEPNLLTFTSISENQGGEHITSKCSGCPVLEVPGNKGDLRLEESF